MIKFNIIELTNIILKYNEMLVKYIKGDLWFKDPQVNEDLKNKKTNDYMNLAKEMALIVNYLDRIGYKFLDQEIIEGIKLPEEMKRKNVEVWLESWAKYEKEN